ncbi:MAG: TIGR02266 family protein [Myxococcaceae bacterium]
MNAWVGAAGDFRVFAKTLGYDCPMSEARPKLDGGPEAGIDRRQAERIPAKLAVRFSRKEDAARALRAYSLNLSVGGLCLRTQKTYAVGESLQLTLEIDGQAAEVTGVVAWERNGAIGVRFTNLSPELRARLGELVSSLKKS